MTSSTTKSAHNQVIRVLVVSHAYVTGVNQDKLDKIAENENVELGLLVPSTWKSSGWNKTLELEKPYCSFKLYSSKTFFSGRGGAYFYDPLEIWKTIQDFKPDILHIEEEVFSFCAFIFSIISRIKQIPLVLFGWENLDKKLLSPRRILRNFVLSTAQLIICGNNDGRALIYRWGYRGRIEVMPQIGVDTDLFSPREAVLNKETFIVGYLGRLVPLKGVDTLLKASQELIYDGVLDFEVVICGSGESEKSLQEESISRNISNVVTWKGSVTHSQVPDVLCQFDVLVLPSRTGKAWKEQFGHVLIEAMCMGVPVVGSDSGEIPNVIGRADLVFKEGDSRALARILKKLKTDNIWYQEVRSYGLNTVQEKYTNHAVANILVSLWEELLILSKSNY